MYSLLFFDKMVSLKQSDESRTHADELQVHLSLTINVFLCDEVNLHDDGIKKKIGGGVVVNDIMVLDSQ